MAGVGSPWPLWSCNEPRRPRYASQPRLESAGLWLADAVGIRNAHGRSDDGIARAEHLIEVRSRRPPGVYIGAELPLCHSALQMAVIAKASTFPRPRSTDTMYARLSAIRASRMPRSLLTRLS